MAKNGTRPPKGSREARRTGIEPATTGVTGRYSNQLSYRPSLNFPLAESARPRRRTAETVQTSVPLASVKSARNPLQGQ